MKKVANYCGAFLLFCLTYLTGRYGVDYGPHTRFAEKMDFSNIPEMLLKHSEPVWHTLTRLLNAFLPLKPKQCGLIVTAFAMAAAYLISSYYLRKFVKNVEEWKLLCLNTVYHLVSAIYMPWFNSRVYRGQGTPNIWHNPTQNMMRPFMILFFCMLIEELEPIVASGYKKNFPLKKGCVMALIMLLANLSKPAFAMVFFPGIFLLMLIWLVKTRFRSIKLAFQLLAVCLPAALTMLLQYFAIFKSGSGKGGKIIIAPFLVAGHSTPNVFFSMFLLYAFPLFMLIVVIIKRRFNSTHELLLCMLAVGTAEKWLLAEDGNRLYSGNMNWGYTAACTICWFIAVRDYASIYLGKDEKRETTFDKASFGILTFLLAYHLLSGIYYIYTIAVLGKGL